jgi:WD40 repeat protein
MWGILDSEGKKLLEKHTPVFDYRNLNELSNFLISHDGSVVQFKLEQNEDFYVRFSLMEQQLLLDSPIDNTLLPPDTTGLNITDWRSTFQLADKSPKLNDTPLYFPPVGVIIADDVSNVLAIAPDKSSFLLGTNCCFLRLFDTQGKQKRAIIVPAMPIVVNISGDGQKAVAALDDGTIRWYNLNNGEELLALFPHRDGQRWIAWTPSGYYMSSGEYADNLLGWHVNHGRDQAASFYPVGQKYSKTYKRPEVVQRTLVALSEQTALAELYDENIPNEPSKAPILRVETGMHTARINSFDIDGNEQFLVTASHDKTLRLWDITTGNLITTYRVPVYANDGEGVLFSTAISPDGKWIIAAGQTGTTWEENHIIYLFERNSGQLVKRLASSLGTTNNLCFSPNGKLLAASLEEGIQVWETQNWKQIFSDTQYGGTSQSCQFDHLNHLLTTSGDGYIRLYSPNSDTFFKLVKQVQAPGGKQPFHAVFSPNRDKIAVGFDDSTKVNVLNGQTLDLLYTPDTSDVDNGNFVSVAWSPDGQQLCAGGRYHNSNGSHLIRCWSEAGQGNYIDWLASTNTITQLRFIQNGNLVYVSAEPSWGILDTTGQKKQEHVAPIAEYRSISVGDNLPEQKAFWVSYDGGIVQFSFERGRSRPVQFFLNQQRLLLYPSPDSSLELADTTGLNIIDWHQNTQPKLNGTVLPLSEGDVSHSLAIAPNELTFLLGTEYNLELFDATGIPLWTVYLQTMAWAVNISGDGQKAIAALGDGTIRWYNLNTGELLLTFFPHTDGKRWVAWTPSGYYMSSGENADNLLGWHVNQSKDKAAEFYPISALQTEFKRPDIVKKALDTLTEDKAILVANLEKDIDAGEQITTRQRLELVKEKYQINPTPTGLGKAIIVAASGEQKKNTLFPYTNTATQAMYNMLRERGFSDGDIIYLNPLPPVVPANGYAEIGRQDSRMRDPLTEINEAITKAASELKNGQQFIFYLHGHARQKAIQLGETVELSAQQLKELLAQIPTDIPQIIILDTCHSGSFLEELTGVPNRILITSADIDSKAWTTNKKSFADKFIRVLHSSHVYDAFKEARRIIVNDPKTFGSQRPWLDDDQDGQYIEDKDGQLARTIYIGGQRVSQSALPVITEIHPAIYLNPSETTATLWVKTSVDMNSVNKIVAILNNENDKPTEYLGEQTQFSRQEITLRPNYELQRFEMNYNGFHAAKQWRIFYQMETIEGKMSDFVEGYVRTDSDTSSVTIEAVINQSVYQPRDPFRFEIILTGKGNFDLYVGFIFPNESYYTIRPPFQFSAGNELLPYQQDLQLEKSQVFTVLSLGAGLFPAMPAGEYQACGLLTKAQSDPTDTNNWIKLHCQPFQF